MLLRIPLPRPFAFTPAHPFRGTGAVAFSRLKARVSNVTREIDCPLHAGNYNLTNPAARPHPLQSSNAGDRRIGVVSLVPLNYPVDVLDYVPLWLAFNQLHLSIYDVGSVC